MNKSLLASMLFAFLACISARADAVHWFTQTPDDFQQNLDHRWHYIPGTATYDDGFINSHAVEGLEGQELEVKYVPDGSAAMAVVSNETEICFNDIGDELKESFGSVAGVQVVVGYNTYHVFAVLQPSEKETSWLVTDVPAETNVLYRLSVVITYTQDGGFVRYSAVAPGGTPFDIAEITLPHNVLKPTEYILAGESSVDDVSAWLDGVESDVYHRWQPLYGVYTWRGGAASVVDGCYDVFDIIHAVDLGLAVWTGEVFSAESTGCYSAPGSAIRFTNAVDLVAGTSILHFGGMIVEPGADGVSIAASDLRLGDSTAVTTTYFKFLDNAALGSAATTIRLFGDITIEVATGKTLDLSAAASVTLDPTTYARLHFVGGGTVKLPASGLVASGSVTIDYSGTTDGFKLDGNLTVDASTAFALPDGTEPGTGYKIAEGTVTGGSTSTRRAITVDGESFVADTTITSSLLVYTKASHGDWANYMGVFTWVNGTTFETGEFRVFDAANSCDTETYFRGGEMAADIPGWSDGVFRDFISVFRDHTSEGQALCRDSGYVLRFENSARLNAVVDMSAGSPALGGLLVEPGAAGYSITGTVAATEALRFAAPSATSTNRVEIYEDFAIERTAPVEFYGRSHLQVAAGKTLRAGAVRVDAAGAPRRDRPYLTFAGDGSLSCTGLVTVGAATLDFGSLARGSSDAAFVDGPLTVSSTTRLVLPPTLASGTAYPLCSGTLTMDDGIRPIAFGDGEFAYKTVTVDSANGKVSWSAASVNTATLSSETLNWSAISSGFTAGLPVELKLTCDVRLTMDVTGVSFPALLVTGPYRLQFVMLKKATFTNIFVGRDTSYEYVIAQGLLIGSSQVNCADWNTAFTVQPGLAYDVVVEGKTTSESSWGDPTQGGKAVQVKGPMIIRNRVLLSDRGNSIDPVGSVFIGAGSQVSINAVVNGIRGYVEVPEGSTLTLYESGQVHANYVLAHDGSDFSLVVKGNLNLGTTKQILSQGSVLHVYGGGCVYCDEANEESLTFSSPATLHVCTGTEDEPAELSASIVYDESARLLVEKDATLLVTGVSELNGGTWDPSGSGSIELPSDVSMPLTNDFFCTGGITGSGTVCFYADPSSSLVAPSLMSATWTGECLLRDVALTEFDPSQCGNELSTIAFDGAAGYFAKNVASTAPFVMVPQEVATDPSLDVTSGYDESGESVPNLTGTGVLSISNAGRGNNRHRFFIDEPNTYRGSYSIGAGVLGGIVLGTSDYLTRLAEFGEAIDGQIAVVTNGVEVFANTWWKAPSGINVWTNAYVIENANGASTGEMMSPVVGEGSVQYYGTLDSDRPEAAAAFDATDSLWYGTVEFHGGEYSYERDLVPAGNVHSTILVDGMTGCLAAGASQATLYLVGDGLGITRAVDNSEVSFRRLTGDGPLRIETGSLSLNSSYRFNDVADFTGQFLLDADKTSVLFGEDAVRESDGTLIVGNGIRMHTKMDWKAPYVSFGTYITVVGAAEGDRILRASASNAYIDTGHTRVYIEEGVNIDSRIWYGLEFDSTDKGAYVCKAETPPDMNIAGIGFSYGVDFTNGLAYVSITNYWGGYKFNGKSIARFTIYDADGKVVGAGDCEVSSNGVFIIGGADLPFAPGADFNYDVEIYTDQYKTGETIARGEDFASSAGVRKSFDWFYEDAQSFSAEAPSAIKTGDWTYDEGGARTNEDGEIVFTTTEVSGTQLAVFEPYVGVSNGYVNIHFDDVAFDAIMDLGSSTGGVQNIAGGFASITLACDRETDDSEPYFAVWTSTDVNTTSGRYERATAPVKPVLGEKYSFDITINRAKGTLGYLVNGYPLTNAEGRVFFKMSDASRTKDYELLFKGIGRVTTFDGDQRNANLAAVVNGATTNEYASVDAAVAAATNAGDRVALLWDASWRPSTEDVGRTINFVRDDYTLSIDGSVTNAFTGGGYRFIDNGNGSYTIGVVTYQITFQPNDALGAMPAQEFSVTNMVFNLISNAFVRTGYDFSHWNENENGRGLGSWSDGGLIDMTEYGLADKKLWAQWKVATKMIIIEPADEYVYIERITTNSTDVAGVKYIGHSTLAEREKGRGSVQIPVTYGSTLVVRFSTDIGKTMTTPDWNIDPGYRQYTSISNSFRVANLGTNLPHYTNDVEKIAAGETPAPLDDVSIWGIVHGIPQEAIAAAPLYASASMKLGMTSLLRQEQEIMISDFTTTENYCTFKVTIDGEPLADQSKILPMIMVTDDLTAGWSQVESDKVSLDEEGRVKVDTDGGATFVKIVIK